MSAAGLSIAQVNDFSQLEDHIVGLLKAAVAGMSPAVHVLTGAELEGVREAAQKTPALHVISDGFRPLESGYKIASLEHRWYVVAAVKNVANQRSGSAARREAGPLLAKAMSALLSEQLPGTAKPLEMLPAPRGRYQGGFLYLPSAWKAETVFRKT